MPAECFYSRLSAVFALSVVLWNVSPAIGAQVQQDAGFADLIRTPAGIQATLERCDGHPDFETALANWLETAEPRSQEEREAIRKTSLRLLGDTTDSQVVFGLIDGLLRHALEDVKRDPSVDPKSVAQALYADISRSVSRQRHKTKELAALADGLAEGGVVTDTRQDSFVRDIMRLAEPRALNPVSAANIRPAKAPPQPSFTPRPTAVSTRMSAPSQP